MMHTRVCAVVVTYYPKLLKLQELLQALLHQVQSIVVVDNGSAPETAEWLSKFSLAVQGTTRVKVTVHFLASNMGVAHAQNLGIESALTGAYDYVILFDHDSLPAPDMVAQLVSAANGLQARGVKLAAVGPRYLDSRQNNPPPFIRVEGLRLRRQSCSGTEQVVAVDYLISSGCLIAVDALRKIGLMCSDLFIDYVDIEWGLRARQSEYLSFGVCSAHMKHDLGDEPILFLGKHYPQHSPLRHYYHFRNAVWLYRQKWVPVNWKIVDARRLFLKFWFYGLFAKPRLDHLKMMILGSYHGSKAALGRFS